MDPVEFISVASYLQNSSYEAERRTAVSRSYYALYNVLLDYLYSKGIPFKKDGGDHWRLMRCLTMCANPNAYSLGADLRDLRQARNDADYEMNISIGVSTSQFEFLRARNAIICFNRLGISDLQAIVQSIKSYLLTRGVQV